MSLLLRGDERGDSLSAGGSDTDGPRGEMAWHTRVAGRKASVA